MILHFCPRATWEAALAAGRYAADTLATEGFIHCSTAEQVHLPANAIARGRTDLVLLEIDETRLPQPPRYEPGDPADPASMRFPHVYGPIPAAAVVAVRSFQPGPDGTFAPLAGPDGAPASGPDRGTAPGGSAPASGPDGGTAPGGDGAP